MTQKPRQANQTRSASSNAQEPPHVSQGTNDDQNGYDPHQEAIQNDNGASEKRSDSSTPPGATAESPPRRTSEGNVMSRNVSGVGTSILHSPKPVEAVSASQEDDEEDVPVREISMKHHDAEDLDEATLAHIRKHFEKVVFDRTLDDDEVVNFGLRMERFARQRADLHNTLKGGEDASSSSDFEQCLHEEEEHALGKELFNDMLTYLPRDYNRKTTIWLRRASGIHRSKSFAHDAKDILAANEGSQRATRRMVQNARIKHREKGLQSLGLALADLEKVRGKFKSERVATLRKRMREAAKVDFFQTEQPAAKRSKRQQAAKETKAIKRSEEAEQLVRKARTPNIYLKNSLAQLDWEHRKAEGRDHYVHDEVTPHDFVVQKRYRTEPELREAGIVHRIPDWSASNPHAQTHPSELAHDPPQTRHDPVGYASLVTQMMHVLRGRARSFAAFEFFYSDVDRVWYSQEPFADAAEALGVMPGTQLSKKEWRFIRRKLRKKPRRFTKAFIRTQIKDRNKSRQYIRRVQQGVFSGKEAPAQLTVAIPPRIPVGTTVTAFSQRFRFLQRGKVISYVASSSSYLIQFENVLFGTELCPDTDVASHGGAFSLPFSARTSSELFARHSNVTNDILDCFAGTKASSLMKGSDFELSQGNGSLAALHAAPKQPNPQLQEIVAEREILLVLLRTIEQSLARKKKLQTAIQELFQSRSQKGARGATHMNWLLDNFRQTNAVLESSFGHLRVLYGGLYVPLTQSSGQDVNLSMYSRVLGEATRRSHGSLSPDIEWVEAMQQCLHSFGEDVYKGSRIHVDDWLSDRLMDATKALMSSIYLERFADVRSIGLDAVSLSVEQMTRELCSTNLEEGPYGSFCSEIMATRREAQADLSFALECLRAAVAVRHNQQDAR